MKKVLIEEPFRVSVKRDAQIPTPKEGGGTASSHVLWHLWS